MRNNYLLSSVLAGMLMAAPVSADVISMRTSAAVGDKFSIALNENVKATLTWGDGSTEELTFNGDEVQITVKHPEFTLQSEQGILSLFCPDCSLTELNVVQAPSLQNLTCAGNELARLDLSKNVNLKNLDCSNNQLTTLSLLKNPELESINLSDNLLERLNTNGLTKAKTLICSNNKLESLSMNSMAALESLWCQGNEITSLSFSTSARLVQICGFNNALKSISSNAMEEVQELWMDNNALTTLDLSNSHAEIVSVSNNKLSNIEWNIDDKESLKAFYADGNALMINSLPTLFKKDSLVAYNIDNMQPYHLTDQVNVDEKLDLSDLIRKNAWGYTARAQVVWKKEDGTELVRNEDFKLLNGAYTFYKPFKSISGEVTSSLYPEAVLKIAAFRVVDPTGIEGVNGDAAYQILAKAGQIQVVAPQSMEVKIYNVAGTLFVNEVVEAGTASWTLPGGLYVVNGKKVLLAR